MEKRKYFEKELALIEDKNIKEFAVEMLELLPEYFFDIPASSTGRYHPQFALGEHGLVRHTKMAILNAYTLLQLEMYQPLKKYQDIIIVALLFHDGFKSGVIKQKYTAFEHPLIAAEEIKKHCNTDLKGLLTEEQIELITSAIQSHMGEWNQNNYSDKILPKPETGLQKFVHQADYLASRKYMGFED